ncbi:MAG: hypothetical protein FWE11_03955 [Defluviitaleaceae bacterium]|nr:hypothetical protein [Defluviitaleaceae bacterium]
MNGKDLFNTWAPSWAGKWTRFTKPALFVHANQFSFERVAISVPAIPESIAQYGDGATALIVDLPGAAGVETGLALIEFGFRPIPLYNGIHELSIGALNEVVQNGPIIDALQSGEELLGRVAISENAPPAFLLDSNRNKTITDSFAVFDNRWTIELEDMPEATYMTDAGITQIVLWTSGAIRSDLVPILDSYHYSGFNITVFSENGTTLYRSVYDPGSDTRRGESTIAANQATNATLKEDIRNFENGRFGLLLLTGMAVINLLFMFLGRAEPILWTPPTIMWLTYLWVPEIVGDAIAIAMTVTYLTLYLVSQRQRHLMKVAVYIAGFDILVFVVYVLFYGIAAFTGYSMLYALIAFGFPAICVVFLVKGFQAEEKLRYVDYAEYNTAFDSLDGVGGFREDPFHGGRVPITRRRRHFRGFRGYGGYGGSGRGGYRGGGYRGYGGGYGGGFGG